MNKEFKKLTPKQKVRVERYLEMLSYNPKMNEYMYDSDRIELLDKVERVFYKGYRESDKDWLKGMENIYQKHK